MSVGVHMCIHKAVPPLVAHRILRKNLFLFFFLFEENLFQLSFKKVCTKTGTLAYFMVTEPFSLTVQDAAYQDRSKAKQDSERK